MWKAAFTLENQTIEYKLSAIPVSARTYLSILSRLVRSALLWRMQLFDCCKQSLKRLLYPPPSQPTISYFLRQFWRIRQPRMLPGSMVAQMTEQATQDQKVLGSIPAWIQWDRVSIYSLLWWLYRDDNSPLLNLTYHRASCLNFFFSFANLTNFP